MALDPKKDTETHERAAVHVSANIQEPYEETAELPNNEALTVTQETSDPEH